MARALGLSLDDGGDGGPYTERSTFILDAEGRVERVLRRVRPADHASFLLDILKS